jgi:pumilio family protein 6
LILSSDTKLTAKSIVQEITSNSRSLYDSPQGRRSLLYPLVPRTKRHFTPSQISILAETDALRAKTSKKDDALRASEVKLAASEGLLAFLSEMGSDVARDTGGSLIITEIMLYAGGSK